MISAVDIETLQGDLNVKNKYMKSRTDLIPFWEKATMTIEEASAYSGIGRDTLYRLTNNEKCVFVLWIGTKRRIKRKQLDEYISHAYSI